MKRALFLCAVGAITAALVIPPAHAETFDFSFQGEVNLSGDPGVLGSFLFSGAGTMDASPTIIPGVYQINSVSGTITDNIGDVSNIVSGPPSGLNDDLLYASGLFPSINQPDYFDLSGLGFTLDDGASITLSTGIFYVPFDLSTATLYGVTIPEVISESVTPAATPEPGSLALLGTAILGAAGVMRRRFVSR
jgi:hypothetical protein